jgi:rubrerythrin
VIRIAAAPIVDLVSLRKALQRAIQLELFTIPPYLAALYTLTGKSRSVLYARGIIEDIVEEEMLHMNLACNILNAIGGQPEVNTSAAVPTYPNTLPMALQADWWWN